MSKVTSEEWRELVARYVQLRREWDDAFAAYDALPPRDSGNTDEERRYDAARDAVYDFEDRLLAVTAPDGQAAIFQLKLFGERFHGLDLEDDAVASADEPGGPILRRTQIALSEIVS